MKRIQITLGVCTLLAGLDSGFRPVSAAWPGINGQIAFESTRDGNSEIYIMNADGSEQANLTNHPAADRIPAWSPDGTKIAFQSNRNGNFDIYVMDADGSNLKRLTENPAIDANAWWSPDGERIAFSSSRDVNCPAGTQEARCLEIYVMDADGGGQTRLTFDSGNDGAPAWSPDGQTIVFGRRDNITLTWAIWRMNADGSGQAPLVGAPDNLDFSRHPDWSPDGNRITFERASGSNIDVYVMQPDGSGETRLTTHAAPDLITAWSPEGNRIAFTSQRDGNPEIYVMSADGSSQIRLTNSAGIDSFSDWQPVTRVAVCHATGSAANPYQPIEIGFRGLSDHVGHGDIYPIPADGCPLL